MKIRLTLTPNQAAVLRDIYLNGDLDELGVTEITETPDPPDVHAGANGPGGDDEPFRVEQATLAAALLGLSVPEANRIVKAFSANRLTYEKLKAALHHRATDSGNRPPPSHPPTPLPRVAARWGATAALVLAAASAWAGWVSAPAAALALAALFAATRARTGYWLAGVAVVAATAGVTAWAVRSPVPIPAAPVETSRREEVDRAIAKVKTTTIETKGEGRKVVVGSFPFGERMRDQIDRLLKAHAAHDKEAALKVMREIDEENPEIENDEYTVPDGEQRLIVRAGGEVLFDKVVTIPAGARIVCDVTQPEPGRYAVWFTPPLR